MGKQNTTTTLIIGGSLLATFLIDILLVPSYPIPLIHVIPLLVAVYLASPRAVSAVAILAVVVSIVSDLLQQVPFAVWFPYNFVFALVAIAIVFLAYRLTAQKEANIRLYEQSEFQRARWEAAVDSMIDLVVVGDAEGHATYINSVYAQYMGRQIQAGLPVEEHPTHYQLYQADGTLFDTQDLPLQKAALTGQEVRNVEVVQRHPDATEFVAMWNASPIRDSKARVVGAVAVGRDVTESKKGELALRRAKDYAEKIIQTANVMVVGLDADGMIHVFNEAAEGITGYTREELEGRNWFEVLVPQDRYPQVWAMFGAAAGEQEKIAKTYENPILTKSGEERFIAWRNAVIEEEGHFSGTISFGIDITERRKTEEERERLLSEVAQLAELSQRRAAELQGILDHMVDAVLVCDRTGQLKLVNQPGYELLGLKEPGGLEGGIAAIPQLLQLRRPDGYPLAPNEMAMARALKGEVVTDFDQLLAGLRTGLARYVRANAAPIRDEKGEIVGAVAVIRDVTELTELDRLKGQFIDVAAHELKTPVTIMKGSAQWLLRSLEGVKPAQRKLLESMNRSADRIDRIVGDLLNISQLQQGQLQLTKERFDLVELIEEAIGRVALTASKHEIQLIHAEPLVISADRDRLEQVLFNFLDNAVRYSPKGGKIEVAMRVEDGEAVVSVRDYGVGIPKEKQSRIFQRFYRAHTGTPYDYGGMGVGLYISCEIVTRHGGRTWFESKEGQGSTFSFSLPLPGG